MAKQTTPINERKNRNITLTKRAKITLSELLGWKKEEANTLKEFKRITFVDRVSRRKKNKAARAARKANR